MESNGRPSISGSLVSVTGTSRQAGLETAFPELLSLACSYFVLMLICTVLQNRHFPPIFFPSLDSQPVSKVYSLGESCIDLPTEYFSSTLSNMIVAANISPTVRARVHDKH